MHLKELSDESVDLVITSPPYFGLRNYGNNNQIWGGAKDHIHEFNMEKIKDPMDRGGSGDHDKNGLSGVKINPQEYESGYCKCGAWKGSLGLESHPQEYINHLIEIVSECMRVLKNSGIMFLNIGDSYGSHKDGKSTNISNENRKDSLVIRNKGNDAWFKNKQKLLIPHRVAIALQEKGFIIRDDICWIKKMIIYPNRESIGSTMPFPVKDKLLPATEYIFQIVKNEKYFFNLDSVKTKIKNSTIERAKRPISSTYTNDIEGNPYVKHDGMKGYYDKIKNNYIDYNESSRRTRTKINLCVGKDGYSNRNVKGIDVENANPTNAIMFRRMNQNSKKAIQEHFASFPLSLAEFFIKIGSKEGDIVLDPFAGSGTVGISAYKLNREFILIEKESKYCELIKKRLKSYLEQRKLT